VVVLVAALLAAVSLTRTERRRSAGPRPARLPNALGTTGAGPVVTTGVGLAFDRRPPALPVRSALAGITTAVVVAIGSLTFSSSLDRLANDQQRWGYGWDLALDTTPTATSRLTRELAADRDLRGAALLASSYTLTGDNDGVRAFGLEPIRGGIGYALRSGHQPVGPDEVVVGPDTASRLHLRPGDLTRVAVCPCTGSATAGAYGRVRVVGTALFPEDDEGNFTNALGFSGAGFHRHVGDFPNDTRAVITIAPGHDVATVARDLGRRFPGQLSQYSYPSRPGQIENLTGLRRFPRLLALFTALLGVAALENVLITTLRRRRRELATLRTLGLTPGQTRGAVAWQSVSLAAVAIAIGVPAGLLLGARTWAAATRSTGVATDADQPAFAVALLAVVALAVALTISLPIGWRASRVRPAAVLHTE